MLKKLFIFAFFLTTLISSQSNAQNFNTNQSVSTPYSYNGQITNTQSIVSDSSSVSWPHIIAIESIFLGYSYLSTYTWGAYFTGGSFGAGSLGLTGILLFSNHSDAEITLPLAIGYGFLSYYNFRFAKSHSPTRKFWTNMIGFHATMLTPLAIGLLFNSKKAESDNLTVQPGIGSFKITYKF